VVVVLVEDVVLVVLVNLCFRMVTTAFVIISNSTNTTNKTNTTIALLKNPNRKQSNIIDWLAFDDKIKVIK